MVNTNKIKARIIELGMTQSGVADSMGMAQATLNLKISGKRPLTIKDADKLISILNISKKEIGEYFFN